MRSDFSSHSIFIEFFILAQFFTIRLSLTLCWLANRTMKTIWLKVQLRKILRLNWIFLIWHCHDVYTTKIRDFTKKIRKPYQNKIRNFFCFKRLLYCSSSSTYVHISEHSYPFRCTTRSPPRIYIFIGAVESWVRVGLPKSRKSYRKIQNFSRSCTRPSLDWFIEERV